VSRILPGRKPSVSEEKTSEDKAKAKGFFGRLFRKGKPEEAPEPAPGAEPGSGDEGAATPEAEPLAPVESPAEPAEELAGEEAAAEDAVAEDTPEVQESESSPRAGLFARLRSGLSKTREGFVRKVDRALFGRKEIDAETLEALEEVLITADLGVHTVEALIGEIQERVSRKELTSPEALREHLREAIRDILVADEGHLELGPDRPHVLMVVGVNGVGKTTTIGKIAAQFRARGHKVVLAAADTFRAAAIEQLAIWGERVGATVIRHQHGSDPAAVAFDAVEAARARRADLVIVDTAGRLHTKANLMEELKKVRRVLDKALPGAPHEVLLVLDATTGQNAVSQARTFRDATGVDSIALTKLDGTAKGGVIVAICHELGIPVKYIGIGEGVEDLRPFDARAFVDALF
jgi:fused signal recognition particle receptor